MALATAFFDSLPYIDAEPTADERLAAEALILAEQEQLKESPESTARIEAQLLPEYEPPFTEAMAELLSRVAASYPARNPLEAIDQSRYEAAGSAEETEEKKEQLARLCSAHAYLASRHANLALLEKHGAGAWLLANYHLEAELRSLEEELAAAKQQVDLLAGHRQRVQSEAHGEITSLDRAWRTGVERMVAVEVQIEIIKMRSRDELRRQVA